jgi:hypothetical protein
MLRTMTMKKYFLALTTLLTLTIAQGQTKRANHWYFGYEAGIDFSSGIPIADTLGNMESIEGCGSISDTSGNLLFYSNGEKIWNKNHNIMPNGTSLFGDNSNEEACIIVPLPNDYSKYYIFYGGWDGVFPMITSLYYSIVDMSLDGGNGDVMTSYKNVMLFDTCWSEAIAGTLSCNAKDYWIVTQQNSGYFSSKLYVYLLDSLGLSSPIVQPFNTIGYDMNLSFSQDGSLLATSGLDSSIFILDFDNKTGNLTMRDSIILPSAIGNMVYATAFSPDNSKLYATIWDANDSGYCYISQFDLNSPNILASRINIDSVPFGGSSNGYGYLGRIQLAPDQRIYVCRWSDNNPYVTNPNTNYSLDSIDVINFPNLSGYACNFQRDFLYLNHKPTEIGLPNFISNFTAPKTPINNCETGINEIISLSQVQIFPNPFSSQTTLQTNKTFKGATLTVYNLFGQQVKQIKNISGQTFTLHRDNLQSGLYFLQLTEENKIIATEKLIISD